MSSARNKRNRHHRGYRNKHTGMYYAEIARAMFNGNKIQKIKLLTEEPPVEVEE